MYIEYILISNIIIHILIIYSIALIIGIKINKLLLMISSILDSIYMILYIYFPYYLENIKYFIGIILSLIPFINKDKGNIFRGTILYYLLNISLGGEAYLLFKILKLEYYHIIILSLILFISIYFYKSIYKYNIKTNHLFYDVIIKDKKNTIKLKCYLDTGNIIVSDDLLSIIFLDKKYKIGTYKGKVLSKSVGGNNYIDIYCVDEIYIKINKKYIKRDAYLAFSELKYDGIFGIGLLGG